jgi:hypothetical protein
LRQAFVQGFKRQRDAQLLKHGHRCSTVLARKSLKKLESVGSSDGKQQKKLACALNFQTSFLSMSITAISCIDVVAYMFLR